MRAGGEITAGENQDTQLTVQPDLKLSGEKVEALAVRGFISSLDIFRISRLYRQYQSPCLPDQGQLATLATMIMSREFSQRRRKIILRNTPPKDWEPICRRSLSLLVLP